MLSAMKMESATVQLSVRAATMIQYHLNPIVSDRVRQLYTCDGFNLPTIHKYSTNYKRNKPLTAESVQFLG